MEYYIRALREQNAILIFACLKEKFNSAYSPNALNDLKGSLTRDFQLQVSCMNQCPPGPQVFHWGRFSIFLKIRGDIRECIFIAGVIDTGNKLFSGVNPNVKKVMASAVDTGD
jgi:hypothetical protein